MLPSQSDRPGLRFQIAKPPEAGTEEATEEEDMAAEPNCAFAKGYGRFGIGFTRLATALSNFKQGNIQAESTVAAQWLTSGLKGCHVPHRVESAVSLTRVPSTLLSNYYCHGHPFSPEMEDRPYNQYGQHLHSEREASRLQQGLPSSHQTFSTASALWVVAVGRSPVGVSAHSHHLL